MVPQGLGPSVVTKVLSLAEAERMDKRFFDKILLAIDRHSAIPMVGVSTEVSQARFSNDSGSAETFCPPLARWG